MVISLYVQIQFWLILGTIVYIYFGYPIVLAILGLCFGEKLHKREIYPYVSIVTAAFNEEKHIAETIQNKFEENYPMDKLEYVVVSDASDDRTDVIVQGMRSKYSNLHFIRQNERQGKTAALNKAIEYIKSQSQSEAQEHIIVFADANSIYEENAIKNLVANFADESVGYVTGQMRYITHSESGVSEGCSAYMKYENKLREYETHINSIVGVDGGVDALRLGLYQEMDVSDLPDFILPLSVIEQGYRVVYEPKAIVKEEALQSHESEFKMRVRVALRSYYAIKKKAQLLDPSRFGFFSFELLSHKVLRYMVGLLQIVLLLVNGTLLNTAFLYEILFYFQLAFYVLALLGYCIEKSGRHNSITYIPYYFILLNMSSVIAFILFLRGNKRIMWDPRKG